MTRSSARRRTRLLAAGLSLLLLPAGQALAAGASGAPRLGTDRATSPVHAPGTARTVTLITGDKVTVTYVRGGRSNTADVTLGTDGGKTQQPQQNQQQDQNNQAPDDQGNGQGNELPFPWSR